MSVPHSTEIFTARGWLPYYKVNTDIDKTIGFNPASGRNEWTRITEIIDHGLNEAWDVSNSRWNTEVTPNHLWCVEQQIPVETNLTCEFCSKPFNTFKGINIHRAKSHGRKVTQRLAFRKGLVAVKDFKSTTQIHLAEPAHTGMHLPITDDESEIIGWIMGDGIRQGNNVGIRQSKPEGVERLRELLSDIPHVEDVRKSNEYQNHDPHTFRLKVVWSKDLENRSSYFSPDPMSFVLSMSDSQRSSWLEGIKGAEGTFDYRSSHNRGSGNGWRIFQDSGELAEAIKIAVYLEGFRPSVYLIDQADENGQKMVCGRLSTVHGISEHIGMCDNRVEYRHLKISNKTVKMMWSPCTELGTWTMRQGKHISLTGC